MKYISITFDDGRSDNYLLAKRIMDKYQLQGTVYITTGFIDGTWEGKDILQSPTRPLKTEEILKLYNSGWEIGLHGDKHQSNVEDMHVALTKLQNWGIDNTCWGISIPNSATNESEICELLESEYGKQIAYIRRGRKCNTKSLFNRVLYCVYSIFKINSAYRAFNLPNICAKNKIDISNISSVVVKSNDSPKMIVDFINRIPDDSIVVLMLHSILPSTHPKHGKDPWSFDESKFEALCSVLNTQILNNKLTVSPLMNILKGCQNETSKKQSDCMEH